MPFNARCPGCESLGPCGCNDPNNTKTSSTDVKYIGPNLIGTGIKTCDDLTTILQKIDNAIVALQGGSTTSTTSTTSSTTTTTTTTEIPGDFLVLESGEEDYLLQESGFRISL